MKKELLCFTLYAIIIYLTSSTLNPAIAITQPLGEHETHFCGVSGYHPLWRQHSKRQDNRNYARRFAANLNTGEPRTVRLIYFLPNDRPYRAEVVQEMKDTISDVQTFFADQMEAHGYGRTTFRVETNSQGEPIVHHVDGQYPDSHYLDDTHVVYDELTEMFNHDVNIYLTVVDNSIDGIGTGDGVVAGTGSRRTKQGGQALVTSRLYWDVVAHELGHAFGLQHDFRDDAYIMSYGLSRRRGHSQLSACHAEYLSLHPYFNPDTPIEKEEPPTIKLISPRIYSPGSTSVPVRIQVNDSDGLHQVILHAAQPDNRWSVKLCRGFSGERSAIFKFDYDGVIPSTHDPFYSRNTSLLNPLIHPIVIEAVDMNGEVDSSMWGGGFRFVLFSEALEPLTKVSGDDLRGLPNTPLPAPFVVELRDLNDGSAREGVAVRFTVTAGGGRLSVERAKTDGAGRAESTLTLGPHFGRNTVEVSAEGLTVTFNAVTGNPVAIPDPHLRAIIETELNKGAGEPIAPAGMTTLTILDATNANISDLTGLETATNLRSLRLGGEYIEAERRTINSNSIVNLSPLMGLVHLEFLVLSDNNISDISAVTGLTKLRVLILDNNNITDLTAISGLTYLEQLNLDNNNISDLSPLVANTGLGSGDRVSVRGNPLNAASINTHIPALQNRGVEVRFDNISVEVVEPVSIPDLNLRTTIEKARGKAPGATLTTWDMARLTRFEAIDANITDLTGLEGATNLIDLALGYNAITDHSILSGLTNLIDLDLRGTNTSDLSVLSGLTKLERLYIDRNGISDLSPLAGLTKLTRLALNDNSISDLSPLRGLTNLSWMRLVGNNISDLSPLVANTGLGNGDQVLLNDNPLSYLSIKTHIPALQSRGVTVHFHNRQVQTLTKISGDNQQGIVGEVLMDPFVVEVRDRNGAVFAGVPVSFAVTAGSGMLSVTSTTTDENGRAQSTLTLGADTGTNTVRVRIGDISESVTFNAVAKVVVNLPDPGLRAAIETVLDKASGDPITTDEMATLTDLSAENKNISDLTGLEAAINLTSLALAHNSISDLSVLGDLTHLISLQLGNNAISELSSLVPVLARLTNLTALSLKGNGIMDISALAAFTHLTSLNLSNNSILDILVLENLPHLTNLRLSNNGITDISALSDLTNLTDLDLGFNSISDLSPLVANIGLREGDTIDVGGNSLSYPSIHIHIPTLQERGVDVAFNNRTPTTLLKISGDDQKEVYGETLTHPFVVEVQDGNGDAFEGVPVTFDVTVGGGTLSVTSTTTDADGRAESTLTLGNNVGINTVSVAVAAIQEAVTFNAAAEGLEFNLSVPMGVSLIHVPLKVTAVDGVEKTITSISDLYDALGGAGAVNFLITYDSQAGQWLSYFGPTDTGSVSDRVIADATGIVAGLTTTVSVQLTGTPLGRDGSSTISLTTGLNLIGIPLRDPRVTRVSDLLALDGISGNAPVIILSEGGEFKVVGWAGDPGDIPITGGQGFILNAQQTATVTISGEGWTNTSAVAAAPLVKGIAVTDTTPVLGLRGAVVDEGTGLIGEGFRVRVKNLSTRKAITGLTEGAGYQLTVVDIENGHAAAIGDTLEISAQSSDPFTGVKPLRYTVTAEDVKRSLIQLPELVAYEIPAETELLANYPNPFNPETWIPYRLAEDAFVALTIYDGAGHAVRTLEVGHRVAAVYENRAKAIYWDGRNQVGETVASGVYFYHLSAGDYSATGKMAILK